MAGQQPQSSVETGRPLAWGLQRKPQPRSRERGAEETGQLSLQEPRPVAWRASTRLGARRGQSHAQQPPYRSSTHQRAASRRYSWQVLDTPTFLRRRRAMSREDPQRRGQIPRSGHVTVPPERTRATPVPCAPRHTHSGGQPRGANLGMADASERDEDVAGERKGTERKETCKDPKIPPFPQREKSRPPQTVTR